MNIDKLEYYQLLVSKFAPDECEIVGENSVKNIITSVYSGQSVNYFNSTKGSNIDYSQILTTVASIISIIDITLKVLDHKNKVREKLNREEIIIKIYQETPNDLDFESAIGIDKEKVVEALLETYDAGNN